MTDKKTKETELRFRNDPKALTAIDGFQEICLELQRLHLRTDKALKKIAEKHGVTLKSETYFSLVPKPSLDGDRNGISQS